MGRRDIFKGGGQAKDWIQFESLELMREESLRKVEYVKGVSFLEGEWGGEP